MLPNLLDDLLKAWDTRAPEPQPESPAVLAAPVAVSAAEALAAFPETATEESLPLPEPTIAETASIASTPMESLLSSLLSTYEAPIPAAPEPEPVEEEPALESASVEEEPAPIIPQTPLPLANSAPVKHVAVGLAGRKFAVHVDSVLEAGRFPRTTFVPGLPPHVRGVFSFRGEVLPVIDVRALAGLDPVSNLQDSRILTVQLHPKSNKAAFLFDSLEGIVNLATEASLPASDSATLYPFLNGLCRAESGEFGLLAVERILAQAGCLEAETDPTQ